MGEVSGIEVSNTKHKHKHKTQNTKHKTQTQTQTFFLLHFLPSILPLITLFAFLTFLFGRKCKLGKKSLFGDSITNIPVCFSSKIVGGNKNEKGLEWEIFRLISCILLAKSYSFCLKIMLNILKRLRLCGFVLMGSLFLNRKHHFKDIIGKFELGFASFVHMVEAFQCSWLRVLWWMIFRPLELVVWVWFWVTIPSFRVLDYCIYNLKWSLCFCSYAVEKGFVVLDWLMRPKIL